MNTVPEQVVAPEDIRSMHLRRTALALCGSVLLSGAAGCFSDGDTVDATSNDSSFSRMLGPTDPVACSLGDSFRGDVVAVGDTIVDLRVMVKDRALKTSFSDENVADMQTRLAAQSLLDPSLTTPMLDYARGLNALMEFDGLLATAKAPSSIAIDPSITSPEVATALSKIPDSELADDISTERIYTSEDYQELKAQLAGISDEALRTASAQFLLAKYVYLGGEKEVYDKPEIIADELAIDPEIAESYAAAAAAYPHKYDYGSDAIDSYLDARNNLSRLYDLRKLTVENLIVTGDDVEREFVAELYDLTDRARNELAADIATHNAGIAVQPGQEVQNTVSDNRTFNLNALTGEQICLPETILEDLDAPNDKTMRRFAELAVKDSALSLSFTGGAIGELSPEDQVAMQQVIERTRPWLEAAYASGDIVSTHFVVTELSYNTGPFFLLSSNEVYMLFPKSEKVSAEQLQTGLIHEVSHALSKRLLDNPVTDQERQLRDTFVNSCDAMHTFDNQVGLSAALANKEALAKLAAMSPVEYLPVLSAFETGQVNGVSLQDTINQNTNGNGSYDCADTTFAEVVQAIWSELGEHDYKKANEFMEYFKDNEDFELVRLNWWKAIDEGLFSDLNEGNFLDTESSYGDAYGHSGEDKNEILATSINDAISYTDDYVALLRSYSPEQQAAQLAVLDSAIAIITYRQPLLTDLLRAKQTQILNALPR